MLMQPLIHICVCVCVCVGGWGGVGGWVCLCVCVCVRVCAWCALSMYVRMQKNVYMRMYKQTISRSKYQYPTHITHLTDSY